MPKRRFAVLACATALGAATVARAAAPDPISPALDPFPGAFPSPGSAVAAGTALASRYLGDEPFGNPAIAPRRAASASPMLLRVNRQDLRRENRQVDEQPAFFDAGGGWVAIGLGRWALALYAFQPVLRLEDNAYVRGRLTDPQVVPATLAGSVSTRELRAGAALSFGGERLRVGAAFEWTQREDRYTLTEASGAPTSGTRSAELSGGGAGGQAGIAARLRGDGGRGTVELGLAARRIPALTTDVTVAEELLAGGATSSAFETRRGASVEGGLSLRWTATDALRVLGAAGAHDEQAWDDFGLVRGAGTGWRLGIEVHDARDPWTVRAGFGADEERGVPEPRSGVLGLGLGWRLESTRLEFGLTHRSLRRTGQPNSADDRLLVGVVQTF